MEPTTLALGSEVAPWQIKDFSVALRQAITQAARQQGVTVAEFLHAHFTRHGLGDVEVLSRQALPQQTGWQDDLYRLVQVVAMLPECRERKTLANSIARKLREAVPPLLPKPTEVGSDRRQGGDLRLDAPSAI